MRLVLPLFAALLWPSAWGLTMQKEELPKGKYSWHRGVFEVNGTVGQDTVELFSMLNPCVPCQQHKRYGEAHDGGYVVCQDHLAQGTPPIASYSYGVHLRDKWSQDIARAFNVPVFQYDCFVPNVTKCKLSGRQDCDQHFFPECLANDGAVGSQKFTKFAEHLKRNGHLDAPDHSLIVKVDIEGGEWKWLANLPLNMLKKIKYLQTELHFMHRFKKHPLYLKALKRLEEAGFRVQHIHSNNWATYNNVYEDLPYRVPEHLEVSYVPFDGECNGEQYPYVVPEDASNKFRRVDLDPPILPARTTKLRQSTPTHKQER